MPINWFQTGTLKVKIEHVEWRNGVAYYRRRIPTELQRTLGKRTLFFSLKTRDLKEAATKAKQQTQSLDRQWFLLRSQDGSGSSDRAKAMAVLDRLGLKPGQASEYELQGVDPEALLNEVAPSTYYDHMTKRADPARLSDRACRDEALRPEIRRVFEENWRVYGVRKLWRQLGREGFDVARCTVARLMKDMGIQGIIRGKPHRTTIPDMKAPCPLDKVNREFRAPAPNMLWVSDFTYVATWKGFAYVAFVVDAYARKIVGWRVSTSAQAGFVLDALEQAVHDRKPTKAGAGPS